MWLQILAISCSQGECALHGTLPGNVGPREENTSSSSFGPGEEDTSQCK